MIRVTHQQWGNAMSDKPKHKNQYRRWYAFRGVILALIVFLGAVGYFLTREPEGEYIYFMRDNSIWRISTIPDATPEIMGSVAEYDYGSYRLTYSDTLYYISRDGTQIRGRNLNSGEDILLLDCATIAERGRCPSFDIQTDQNLLVYPFYYAKSESPYDFFEVRLLNITQNTDVLLFEFPDWLYRVRWINDHQLEFTTANDLWLYDINGDGLRQVEFDRNRINSPDGSYYTVWTEDNIMSPIRLHYTYFLYTADGRLLNNNPIVPNTEAEPDDVMCWRPDSSGFVYHRLHTEIGHFENTLFYYDISENKTYYLLDLGGGNDIRRIEWSPSSRYMLIYTENPTILYDMQTASSRNLELVETFSIGWMRDSNGNCRGFPYFYQIDNSL
jgi:hypothetical protein